MAAERMRLAAALAAAVVALASDAGAQASRREPPPAAATGLRMQETGIQGEKNRPDVLFVIPSGRGGPLVSPRLRDYGFDIQEPVVKPWLEADLQLGRGNARPGTALDVNWREAIAGADVSVSGPAPAMMGSSIPPPATTGYGSSSAPASPSMIPPVARELPRAGGSSSMIPSSARSMPPPAPAPMPMAEPAPMTGSSPIDGSPIYIPPEPAGRSSSLPPASSGPSSGATSAPPSSMMRVPGSGPAYRR